MTTGKRLGVVMDPISAINYAKDSTLALLLAAQARGFALAYLEMQDLLLRDGVPFGRLRALTVKADPKGWFSLGEAVLEPLSALDCLLMRKDPPFDMEYIYSTYILERAEGRGRTRDQPPPGAARHEREGLHGLVSAVLRADPHHARHARHGRVSQGTRPDRGEAPGWHGRALDLRARRA